MQKRLILVAAVIAVLLGLAFFLSRGQKPERKPVQASSSAPRARTTHVRRTARGRDAGSSKAFVPLPSASARASEPRRVEQLHTSVLAAAVRGNWLTIDERGTPCAPDRVRIVYDAPDGLSRYTKGAYFEPLGPSPSDSSQEVNGLLLCDGSEFLYLGFEAYFREDRRQWDIYPFPAVE